MSDYDAYEEEEPAEEAYEPNEVAPEIAHDFDEFLLEDFVLTFRNYYELALQDDYFYWIEDMLLPGSTAYTELQEYIADISGQGMTFNFTSNTVTDIVFAEDIAVVTTFEVFDFISADGELTNFERIKDYHIVADQLGNYKITTIEIYE